MTINTREQLKSHIHSIHDLLRNSGAGYGMVALKIFIFFYGLKVLEPVIKKMLEDIYEYDESKHVKGMDSDEESDSDEDSDSNEELDGDNNEDKLAVRCNDNKDKELSMLIKICDMIKENKNNTIDEIFKLVKPYKNIQKWGRYCLFSKLIENIDSEEYVQKFIHNAFKFIRVNSGVMRNIYYYIYHDIPSHITFRTIVSIIQKIDEIPVQNNINTNKNIKLIDAKYQENVNITGKVYEYFIGRDSSAISELGAYFTDRHIINHIIKKVDPNIDNGVIQTMMDPFGGSGGFTLGYLQHLTEKGVDWLKQDKQEIYNYMKIYHYDMNEDVIKIAGIEFNTITKRFPNSSREQFKCTNTFKDMFKDGFNKDIRAKYIFSNPPYGGDKSVKTPELVNNEKIIAHTQQQLNIINTEYTNNNKYFSIVNEIGIRGKHNKDIIRYSCKNLGIIMKELEKNKKKNSTLLKIIGNVNANIQHIIHLSKINDDIKKKQANDQVNFNTCSDLVKKYITDNNITGCNDKEACSLVLFMALLEEKGTCAVVLKEGVFFDSKYSSVRGHLINNFHVKYIISIDADQFENTTTKTSALIFENVKPNDDSETIFYKLEVNKEKDDVYVQLENFTFELSKRKGDIVDVVEKEVARATKKELCSPTIEERKVKGKVEKIEKYSYSLSSKQYDMKLKNVECDDKYKMVKLYNICKFQRGTRFTKDINISDNITDVLNIPVYGAGKIIGYGSKSNRTGLNCILARVGGINSMNCAKIINGNLFLTDAAFTIDVIDKKYKNHVYHHMIHNYDNIFRNYGSGSVQVTISSSMLENIQIPIPKSTTLLQEWTTKISTPYDLMNKKKEEFKKLENEVKDEVMRIMEEEDCEEMKLGDICKIKGGKRLPNGKSFSNYKTNHPYIRITNIKNNAILQDNIQYISDEIYNVISKYIVSTGDILISIAGTVGIITYIPSWLNGANLTENMVKLCNIKINNKYIQYFLIINSDKLYNLAKKTTINKISINNLEKLEIKIPKNTQLITDIQPKFTLLDKLQEEIKQAEQEYNTLLQELNEDTKKKDNENAPKNDLKNCNNSDITDTLDSTDENKTILCNKTKQNNKLNIHKLSELTEYIELGENILETKPKKSNDYKIPYFTANKVRYCQEGQFTGNHILCVRNGENIGGFYKAKKSFSANKNLIVMKIKDDYEDNFDDIYEYVSDNFDYEDYVKDGGNILKKHFKDFDVEF